MGRDRCRWVRARLPLLAGDDWLGPDRRRVERHLIGCLPCRERFESLGQVVRALRAVGECSTSVGPAAVGPESAPATLSLWPALARQIRESRRPEPAWTEFNWSGAPLRVGLAASLLVAALALGARQDVRSQVSRLIVSITHRTLPSASVFKRVANQTPAPADQGEDETTLADSASLVRPHAGDVTRTAAPIDPHAAEPTH
jgi:hypothetical protein